MVSTGFRIWTACTAGGTWHQPASVRVQTGFRTGSVPVPNRFRTRGRRCRRSGPEIFGVETAASHVSCLSVSDFKSFTRTARSSRSACGLASSRTTRIEDGGRRWWLRVCLSVPFIVPRFYYLTHSLTTDSPKPPISFLLDEILRCAGRPLQSMRQTFLERSMALSPRHVSRFTVADRISTTFAVVANAAQSFMSARRFSSF